MNFEEYKDWRDDMLSGFEVPAANRFDCLNPFKAMDFTQRWKAPGAYVEASPEVAVALWKAVHFAGLPEGMSEQLEVQPTRGVRSALGALFARMEARGMELWLPEDVYPFYLKEAKTVAPNLRIRFFRTIPTPDLSELSSASASACILITDPLTPTGGFLTAPQRRAIADWTRAGGDRWAVFDSVYLYSSIIPCSLFEEMESERSIHLFSMSKSWLLRGVFGTAIGPVDGSDWWKNLDLEPTAEASASAISALTTDRYMPERQQSVFQSEWIRRWPQLEQFGCTRPTMGHGYFRLVEINFERVFHNKRTLFVPASVFGSKNRNWAVATCLYEAAAFNRH